MSYKSEYWKDIYDIPNKIKLNQNIKQYPTIHFNLYSSQGLNS